MASIAKYTSLAKVIIILLLVIPCSQIISCKPKVRSRGYGYLKIRPIADIPFGATHYPDLRLLVRRDDRGISVMSTECTHDLTPLVLEDKGDQQLFVSTNSESQYSFEGKVLKGPAVANLPYYKLEINDGEWEGKDTVVLYVRLGEEVPANWRLKFSTPNP